MYAYPKTVRKFDLGEVVVEEPPGQFHIVHLNRTYVNKPINMVLVQTFYVDQTFIAATLTVYAIVFQFSSDDCHQYEKWHFTDKDMRDAEYEKLIDQTCGEFTNGKI